MRHICATSSPALKSRAEFEMTALFPLMAASLPRFRRSDGESPVQIYPQGFSF
jgi:hypothetical protein